MLVYVGATLPLLLVLQSAGVSSTDALNAQDVAEPIVATLVGAMALLICVPSRPRSPLHSSLASRPTRCPTPVPVITHD